MTSVWAPAMTLAVDQARAALATGDVPVGAVLVSSDPPHALVSAAHNAREADGDPTAHAEILALRAAAKARGAWRLDGLTMVVTLEPCTMCAGALVLARVDRLVYGAADPKAGAAGSRWDLVRDPRLNHRPDVVAEVSEPECAALLLSFFAERRTRSATLGGTGGVA